MRISPDLFGAYLLCPTGCWIKAHGEQGTGNAHAEWVAGQNEAYRVAGVEQLRSCSTPGEHVTSPPSHTLKEGRWRLAFDVRAETKDLESQIQAVERVPSEGRGKPAQFIPVRFVYRNKLTKQDRLLVAFDAVVLSGLLGREVGVGKIFHGDDFAVLMVKIAALTAQARKMNDRIASLLSGTSPPDLILNRHCPECEFKDRCRQKATEKDDLSVLGGMTAEERKEYNQKGIFTATQLSYTFRPRRRPNSGTNARNTTTPSRL